MKSWNAEQAPAGIFWRWGDEHNLTWFDYLVTSSLKGISGENLFENWKKRAARQVELMPPGLVRLGIARFHVCFMNQNQDYRQEPAVKKPRV
jgi:hypothetical protein